MIGDRKMFKGALIAVFLMVIIEQSHLRIAGAIIKEDHDRIRVFIDEISKDAGEIPAEPTCRTDRIFGMYAYKMCLETETRNGARPVRVQFPAGFLTLVPRMYQDRYIFDGRYVAVLTADGSVEFLNVKRFGANAKPDGQHDAQDRRRDERAGEASKALLWTGLRLG